MRPSRCRLPRNPAAHYAAAGFLDSLSPAPWGQGSSGVLDWVRS